MKTSITKTFWVSAIFALGLCWTQGHAVAQSTHATPTEVIKDVTARALQLVHDCAGNAPEDIKARREAVRALALEYVDFEEAAKRTMGRHWRRMSPEQRSEFVRLFKDLLYFTYIGKLDSYTCGEEEQIHYEGERVQGRYALVKTSVRYQNQDVAVEYRMLQSGGRWMVYDVVIEGISYVNNYRSQFDSLLVNRSVDDFLERLRQKVAELEKNDRLGS
ncbi:MlaC/ttg2D family ABC transporter substrate-binding protein [Desulfosoma caldarium]|uniref:Phospholipid transport system substrate-binding protein n=1 Tax=Desulfosoma caldarium TaxID=610254 RepID=A0A3N1UQX3_9BACT|nr:ABC transporter substrate-binding protein [Desulfosoma caldarium]ROQ92138.1 phospholipid transport system substrate-binding protein [Desulfosoma caldarium]